MPFSPSSAAQIRNNGAYDSVPYKDWGYTGTPRNLHESNPQDTNGILAQTQRLKAIEAVELKSESTNATTQEGIPTDRELNQHFRPAPNRALRPRYLCILRDPPTTNELPNT